MDGSVPKDKKHEVGIPVEGGVITFEPPCSKARFWIRETVPRLVWGLTLGDDPYAFGEIRSPVFIVIWNPERTVEYYREGPYKGSKRDKILEKLREEIADDGLTEVLFRLHHGTGRT
jgi:hypothetical protein